MNKLPAADVKRKGLLIEKLRSAEDALRESMEDVERRFEELKKEAVSHVQTYNAVVEEAQEFRQDIANQLQEVFNEKSERWQESDKGRAWEEWIGEWDQDLECLDDDGESIDLTSGEGIVGESVADILENFRDELE